MLWDKTRPVGKPSLPCSFSINPISSSSFTGRWLHRAQLPKGTWQLRKGKLVVGWSRDPRAAQRKLSSVQGHYPRVCGTGTLGNLRVLLLHHPTCPFAAVTTVQVPSAHVQVQVSLCHSPLPTGMICGQGAFDKLLKSQLLDAPVIPRVSSNVFPPSLWLYTYLRLNSGRIS